MILAFIIGVATGICGTYVVMRKNKSSKGAGGIKQDENKNDELGRQ